MPEAMIIGIFRAKRPLQHAAHEDSSGVFHRKLYRGLVLVVFALLVGWFVAMEACASAQRPGPSPRHSVRLPPQVCVKSFARCQ